MRTAIIFFIQFLVYIPVFMVWKIDTRTAKKEDLAVSLAERTFLCLIMFPVWVAIFLK